MAAINSPTVVVCNHTFEDVTVFQRGARKKMGPKTSASMRFNPSIVERFFRKRACYIQLEIGGGRGEREPIRIDCVDRMTVVVLETAQYLLEIVKGSPSAGEFEIEVDIHYANESPFCVFKTASGFIPKEPSTGRDLDLVCESQAHAESSTTVHFPKGMNLGDDIGCGYAL